jgi:hypothetical protein
MSKTVRTTLGEDEWTTVRARGDGPDDGHPRYEAKYVAEVDRASLEDDLVLVKETDPVLGGERRYQIPREVFEAVVDRLP